MPRVYLTFQEEMNRKLVSKIYGTMKVQHKSQKVMAAELDITQQAFSKKLKLANFTFAELTKIFKVLEFQDHDILAVMKEG